LDVLIHMHHSSGAFILGSTEPHYTPSKTYQSVLSGKPIWAILHHESTAAAVLDETNSGEVLTFSDFANIASMEEAIPQSFERFKNFALAFDPALVDRGKFENYSAREVTRQLSELFNQVVSR